MFFGKVNYILASIQVLLLLNVNNNNSNQTNVILSLEIIIAHPDRIIQASN